MNNDILTPDVVRANIREHEQQCHMCHMRAATQHGARCDVGLALLYTHLVALREEQHKRTEQQLALLRQTISESYMFRKQP